MPRRQMAGILWARFWSAVLLFLVLVSAASGGAVHLNEVQVIGTHNSYHLAPHPSLLGLIAGKSQWVAQTFQYSHRPLQEQFSVLGIRQIELDLYVDPKGGLFADPMGNRVAVARGLPVDLPLDPTGVLLKPGFKVLHDQDFDFRTTVLTLTLALRQVRAWSATNPSHFPILILLDLKRASLGTSGTLSFGARDLDSLDTEILSVFSREAILTPNQVRGTYDTLAEAVTRGGWPELSALCGKVFFALSNRGRIRDLYLRGHPSLRGRLLFVDVPESHPAAAWMRIDDPVAGFSRIQNLIKAGFLVRTRADANTEEARKNDTTRRDKALASGAQFISTDYPQADPALSDYRVAFKEGVTVRANPVNGDPQLKGKDLDSCRRVQ